MNFVLGKPNKVITNIKPGLRFDCGVYLNRQLICKFVMAIIRSSVLSLLLSNISEGLLKILLPDENFNN